MKTVSERVLDMVNEHPNQDQEELAKLLGKTRSHVSNCIKGLERHNLVGYSLVSVNDTGPRHRGYFTVDGARLKRACAHCGGEMHLYGFRSDELVQKCSKCNRTVVLH